MKILLKLPLLVLCCLLFKSADCQIVINEGSNKNYSIVSDEDGEFPDWIELHNAGTDTVQLEGFTLSDDSSKPGKWTFPKETLLPGAYTVVFCSGKNRKPISGFITVLSETHYTPVAGWNNHVLATPFYWDGASSLLVNTCSYSSTGYTTNSVFNQTLTPYLSTIVTAMDGSPISCSAKYGGRVPIRPNIRLNGVVVGQGAQQNSPYDYPAPYGNWYWSARNQMIIPAAELIAAGLTAGNIDSLAFDVVSSDPNTVYDFIDFSLKLVSYDEIGTEFEPVNANKFLHTNFKIATGGETVYLYTPDQQLLSSLNVHCDRPDLSVGLSPDASANIALFLTPTPSATNNTSQPYFATLLPPEIEVPSGMYNSFFAVNISNPNGPGSVVRYTLNGDDPDENAPVYTGNPLLIFYSSVLKVKAFSANELPSETAVASYLLGVSHTTPVLSVVTDPQNLYGPNGIFDNWIFDWEKAAYVEYFDTARQLVFGQRAGIQIDGGAGGSRANPQHSFRVELDHSILGEGPIDYPLIPNRPSRTRYSSFYLRNGSNYYLIFPHKDAALVEGMGAETNNYYSAWRPVTVYVNGAYFGLYELREKFDTDFFAAQDSAASDSMDILSLSYWKGSVLRAVQGSVDSFFTDYNAFKQLDPAADTFWDDADQYVDMAYYNDYIIAETWAGNIDWPGNNIKIYRSDKTGFRWRFCLIDLEGSLNPGGFSTAYDNHIAYVLNGNPDIPYINIFLRSIQNPRFRNYFINRYADLMNTSYLYSRLSSVENAMFGQMAIEMPREYMRWGDPNNVPGQMEAFVNNHHIFQSELSVRTEQVRNHIQENFGLDAQVDVTLDVFPAGAGKIKISTITPAPLPWTGVYFNGNPVTLTAIPNPGYAFAYWDTNDVLTSIDTSASIRLNITAGTLFKAVFDSTGLLGKIAISELNYHADSTRNSGDWMELHNYGNAPMDMSGWVLTDSTNQYVFPAGTLLAPDAYLVLASDTALFRAQFPLLNPLGPIGFNFSNSSEVLTMVDQQNAPVAQMRYEDANPWPVAADGYGRTLELRQDTLDPALPSSWFAGCVGGSPGKAFTPCTEQVVFSEINYQSAITADAGDWVELWNTANDSLDISGWVFSDNDNTHRFGVPDNTILPGLGRVVLATDTALFRARFPQVGNYAGPTGFGLSSTGEAIRLYDHSGRLYQSMVYDQKVPWPQGANGNGYTLELVDAAADLCDGANWQDGCPEGSPGRELELPCNTSATHTVFANDEKFFLYPNPSSGVFTVAMLDQAAFRDNVQVEVFNAVGTKIYAAATPHPGARMTVDLSGVPKGIYWLRLWVDGRGGKSVVLFVE